MKKVAIFILLLSTCCFTASPQRKNAFFFERLSAEDGLSQISVTTIFQDSRRYMWFGTRDGLNRYNGNEFKVYKHDVTDSTSISDSYIRCICEDKQKTSGLAQRTA